MEFHKNQMELVGALQINLKTIILEIMKFIKDHWKMEQAISL